MMQRRSLGSLSDAKQLTVVGAEAFRLKKSTTWSPPASGPAKTSVTPGALSACPRPIRTTDNKREPRLSQSEEVWWRTVRARQLRWPSCPRTPDTNCPRGTPGGWKGGGVTPLVSKSQTCRPASVGEQGVTPTLCMPVRTHIDSGEKIPNEDSSNRRFVMETSREQQDGKMTEESAYPLRAR